MSPGLATVPRVAGRGSWRAPSSTRARRSARASRTSIAMCCRRSSPRLRRSASPSSRGGLQPGALRASAVGLPGRPQLEGRCPGRGRASP
eukprot:4370367-Pyramimonas_sp.AAC.1